MVEVNQATDEFECPICGAINDVKSLQCKKCMTPFGRGEGGEDAGALVVKPLKVQKMEEVAIDEDAELGEDEQKAIEELMNIPGVDKYKARQLYTLGFTGLSNLIEKTVSLGGKGKGMSKIIANRIMLQQIGTEYGGEEDKGGECPFCGSKISIAQERCPVCNRDLTGQILSLDIDSVMLDVSDYVGDVFDQLSQDSAFIKMPEDLKAQVADLLGDDGGIGELLADTGITPEEIEASLADAGAAGEPPDESISTTEDAVAGPEPEPTPEPEPEAEPAPEVEAEPEAEVPEPEIEPVEEAPAPGGDVTPSKGARRVKRTTEDKAAILKREREKCHLKVEQWRKKGFDEKELDELEALIGTDLVEFKRRSIAMLKKRLESVSAKKKKKKKLVKKVKEEQLQCPKCEALNPVNAKKCKGCGVKFET